MFLSVYAWPSADVPGFCKAASLDEIRKNGHVLTPGRYVGAAAKEDGGEPFEEKMDRLTKELSAQLAEGRRLEEEIASGYKTTIPENKVSPLASRRFAARV